jgi:hypothetical protein
MCVAKVYSVSKRLLRRSPHRLFPLVLGLGGVSRLPLHVGRGIRAATLEGNDVINHVARAAMRVAGLPLEGRTS